MKVWAWVIGALVAIWSVVWLAGSIATERLVTYWLADREAAGWVVARDAVQTTGYPFRFVNHPAGADAGRSVHRMGGRGGRLPAGTGQLSAAGDPRSLAPPSMFCPPRSNT